MEEEAGEIQIVRGAQPTLIGFEIGATDQRMWGPLVLGASTGVPTHDKGHAERPDMQRRVRTQGAPPGPA